MSSGDTNGHKVVKANALIVGLGAVGAGDLKQNNTTPVQISSAHAASIDKRSSLTLLAGVDSNIERRSQFSLRYDKPSYESLDQYLIESDAETQLVVVATPTNTHLSVVREVVHSISPRIIVCEKPLGLTDVETKEILALCNDNGIICLPGYFRKFCDEVESTLERISVGEFGAFKEGFVCYGQELVVNGCHFLHLALNFVNGHNREFRIKNVENASTPNPTFEVRFSDDTKINFVGINSDFRRTGQVQLFFDSGMVLYENGGSKLTIAKSEPRKSWVSEKDEVYYMQSNLNIEKLYDEIERLLNGTISTSKREVGLLEIKTQEIMNAVLQDVFRFKIKRRISK